MIHDTICMENERFNFSMLFFRTFFTRCPIFYIKRWKRTFLETKWLVICSALLLFIVHTWNEFSWRLSLSQMKFNIFLPASAQNMIFKPNNYFSRAASWIVATSFHTYILKFEKKLCILQAFIFGTLKWFWWFSSASYRIVVVQF